MTISDQIRRLQNAKAAIKQSLTNKGVTVSDEAKIDEYPALIDSISQNNNEGEGESLYSELYPYIYLCRTWNNTSFTYLFSGLGNYSDITTLDVTVLDASNVTNMSYMFSVCSKLTNIVGLESFDTSKVTNMASMFSSCYALTSLNLSSFDTTNVTNMRYMFENCTALQKLGLSNFNTGSVTDMRYMFYNCTALQELDLSNWTVHGADTNRMLYNCSSLAKLKLCNCDEETIRNIVESTDFPIGEIEGKIRKLYVDEDLIDIVSLPEGWEYKTLPPLYEEGQFERDRNLVEAETRVDSSHTDLSNMFLQCKSLESVDTEDWDTSNVTNMNKMFYYCDALVTLDLSSFNTSKVTEMRQMFDNCNSLETLDLSNWDTSNVEMMDRMFGSGLRKLATLRMLNCSFDTIEAILSVLLRGSDSTLYINLSEEEAERLTLPTGWSYEII